MDRLEALGQQLSQITLYDLKSYYNQAKNIVLNVSEMEAKVREATNEDPWGASSTLMQEIAQGTFNFQHFNEIMPCIYSRFMEKEASQWRQIYKALQLLEYIIKHGSERVVDDARSHISTIKMLRNFHYIDEKGKDQGVNVRQRAKELTEVLGDLDRLRAERRKAKANRSKYVGTGNDPSSLSFSSGGGRYDGFGSDSFSGGGDYDYDGGRPAGSSFRDESSARRGYDEYDAGEFEDSPRRANSLRNKLTSSSSSPVSPAGRFAARHSATSAPVKSVPASAPVVDLLGGFDDESAPAPSAASTAPPASNVLDDDFDDFQSAPPSAPAPGVHTVVAPTHAPKLTAANVFDMLGSTSVPEPNAATNSFALGASPMRPTTMQPTRTTSTSTTNSVPPFNILSPATSSSSRDTIGNAGTMATAVMAKASNNFDDLWNVSFSSSGPSSAPTVSASSTAGKSIKDLEKEKANASMWGLNAAAKPNNGFGVASEAAPSSGSFGGGNDDLLL